MENKSRSETEEIATLMTEGYLKERAKKSIRAKYEVLLAKIPSVEIKGYDRCD